MTRFKPYAVVGVLCVCAAALASSAGVSQEKQVDDSSAIFELRTYITHPERLKALHARFRDHTMKLFEKHGMENVIYWTPIEEDGKPSENTLVYVLKHKSRDAAKKSWEDFRTDPEWQEARKKSEEDGPIVQKVVSLYLKPTEFSPHR